MHYLHVHMSDILAYQNLILIDFDESLTPVVLTMSTF